MFPFSRRWRSAVTPGAGPSRFRPALLALEGRITPAIAFGSRVTGTAGDLSRSVAVGDFDGDGRPDLAFANVTTGIAGGTVSVLRNTTAVGAVAPAFAAQQTFAVGQSPSELSVGDFDGDGRPDLAVANYISNTVSVLRNTTPFGATAVSFAAQQMFSVGTGPFAVVVGDFNGDGRDDFATANGNANSVSVRLNTTPLGTNPVSFAAPLSVALGAGPRDLTVADFDGDGRADLAAVSSASALGVTLWVLFNQTAVGAGVPQFAVQSFTAGNFPDGVAAGDFNGDGRADLAAVNANGAVSVLLNTTAAGGAAFGAAQPFAVGTAPTDLAVGDFDNDGRADVAAANSNFGIGTTVSVLRNVTGVGAATAAFAPQQTFASGLGPQALAAADFNSDGRPDLAVGYYLGTTVGVLPNATTDGAYTTTPAVAGQFGTAGVWAFNRSSGGWGNLTGANANALANAPNGNIVAAFGGSGVWYYRPLAGWALINGYGASAVAVDGLGNAYASFPGFGVAVYRPVLGTWTVLTGAVATALAANADGDLVGNFPGFGVYTYQPTTNWVRINGQDATALAVAPNGDVVASFAGYGLNIHTPTTSWRQVNGYEAAAVAFAGNGAVVAHFPGFGLAKYVTHIAWWQQLHSGTPVVSLAADFYGNVFASFGGFGVYEFNPFAGWRLRTGTAASLLASGS